MLEEEDLVNKYSDMAAEDEARVAQDERGQHRRASGSEDVSMQPHQFDSKGKDEPADLGEVENAAAGDRDEHIEIDEKARTQRREDELASPSEDLEDEQSCALPSSLAMSLMPFDSRSGPRFERRHSRLRRALLQGRL